jgi:hypothetical protein
MLASGIANGALETDTQVAMHQRVIQIGRRLNPVFRLQSLHPVHPLDRSDHELNRPCQRPALSP